MTKEELCSRLVKAGAACMAKCTPDDKDTVTYVNFKKALDTTKDDWEKALKVEHPDYHADVLSHRRRCLR